MLAKGRLARLVRWGARKGDTLVTLTYPPGTGKKEAQKIFHRWREAMYRWGYGRFQYIKVYEVGVKNVNIHIHLIMRMELDKQDLDVVHYLWGVASDALWIRAEKIFSEGLPLGRYLGKYLSKEGGRYSRSKGWIVEPWKTWRKVYKQVAKALGIPVILTKETGIEVYEKKGEEIERICENYFCGKEKNGLS